MFKIDYNKKLEKLKNKKISEKNLLIGLLEQYKKDNKINEKSEAKINRIIDKYTEAICNCEIETNITKEIYKKYKAIFKEIATSW